jgi:hypothetical protein
MWTNFVTWIGSVLEQITQTNGGSLGLAIITLALYQKEGVSPLDGKSILVSLLRAPIFIAVAQTFRSPSKERVVSY